MMSHAPIIITVAAAGIRIRLLLHAPVQVVETSDELSGQCLRRFIVPMLPPTGAVLVLSAGAVFNVPRSVRSIL